MSTPFLPSNLTFDGVVNEVTCNFFNSIDPKNPPMLRDAAEELYLRTQATIAARNRNADKSAKWPMPKALTSFQIAYTISRCCPVCRLQCEQKGLNDDNFTFAVYQDSGEHAGLYDTSEEALDRLIRICDYLIKRQDIKEVRDILKFFVPRRCQNEDRDLIAVDNGLFDFRTKRLFPFSPEYVFLAKCRVAYVPNATNPIIHNPNDGTDWDVETWIQELFDDKELTNLIWEILSAIVRPYVHWNKLILFSSPSGCNGKGTLCQLLRNLCGSCVSIPMAKFSERFGLANLVGALAVITDENPVGKYLEESEQLKAAITHDVVQIEKKGKDRFDYRFHGLIVQCINQLDRTRDKSDSFYRRLLIVPFNKTFKDNDRKYIKNDYINRTEVLEYILNRVLNMDHYEFSEPKACREELGVFKETNETVLQFANEILPECCWDLLPFGFLFDLYHEWMRRNCPSSEVPNKTSFIDNLLKIIESNSEWQCRGRKAPVRPQGKMDWPEPLIEEYRLQSWGWFPSYTSVPGYHNALRLKANYNGLVRVHPKGSPNQPSGSRPGPVPTN